MKKTSKIFITAILCIQLLSCLIVNSSAENSSSLPIAEYPDGSYFSKNSTGCTCHGVSCSYSSDTPCDCIRAHDTSGSGYAIQGHAFACYVYRMLWGISEDSPLNTENRVDGIKLDEDKDKALTEIKTFIESNLNEGSLIRLTKKTGSKHTMIIASIDPENNRITAYHANVVTNNCKVRYQYITYEKIVRLYSKVDYAFKGGK